jgi:peroxiredoxin
MLRVLSLFILAVTLATPALALGLGKPAPDFTTFDSNGKVVKLSDFKGKTVVLEWTNNECPFVKKFYESGKMQELQKKATADGAVWLSVISSADGKQGHVDGAKANELTKSRDAAPSHVLLDGKGEIGKAYDARTTPHMFVVDGEGKLQYMGALDDRPSTEIKDVAGARNYVELALASLKNGKSPEPGETKSYGCAVKY